MTDENNKGDIKLIPIESIRVVMPHHRGRRVTAELVKSILTVGLKRPVTVCERVGEGQITHYDLAYGEARLEAFKLLNQPTIPAVIVDLSEGELILMGLVENIARRHMKPSELLSDLLNMVERGHSQSDIARSIGQSEEYVEGVQLLLRNSEATLISAVYSGRLPVQIATMMATSSEDRALSILGKAQEQGLLKCAQFRWAENYLEKRSKRKGVSKGKWTDGRVKSQNPKSLFSAVEIETQRQKKLAQNIETARSRLVILSDGITSLLGDSGFVAALEREGLNSIPATLARLLEESGGGGGDDQS